MIKRANIPWSRIDARLAELGKDQAWLRTALGIEANVITNWKSRGAPASKALQIAQALDLSTDQLLGHPDANNAVTGDLRILVGDESNSTSYAIKRVKLLLRAGFAGFEAVPDIYDGGTVNLPRHWVERKNLNPTSLMAMTITGESMEPNLYEGDVVIINTADTSMKDGAVFAFNYDGEAVIKRLVKERGDWWLFSDNVDQARHRPKGCRSGECVIIGRVVKRETDHI